jgi:hypothetical protein
LVKGTNKEKEKEERHGNVMSPSIFWYHRNNSAPQLAIIYLFINWMNDSYI